MAMRIEKSFVVAAPAGAVWDFLTDPYRVARCLPGAAITGQPDPATWAGTITVKVGPVTAAYRGTLRFPRLDAAARQAELAASGQETRGKGGAELRMESRVVERAPGETEVTVVSDVNVVGVLAQFGRGMIQDVSDQLFQRFTQAMRRELEAPAAPAEPAAEPAASPAPAESAAATVGDSPAVPPAPTVPDSPAASAAPAAGVAAPAPAAAPITAPPPPGTEASAVAPLDLGALGAAAAARAAGRMLRRPGFWIGVAILGLAIYLLYRSLAH